MRAIIAFSVLSLVSAATAAETTRVPEPIIDVHLHTHAADRFGVAGLPDPTTGKPSAAVTGNALLKEFTPALVDRARHTNAVQSFELASVVQRAQCDAHDVADSEMMRAAAPSLRWLPPAQRFTGLI